MGMDRRLVVELVKILEDPSSKPERDEFGFEWKRSFCYLRPLHILEGDKVVDLPSSLRGVLIEQPRKLCISPDYRWHFTMTIEGKPVEYNLSARRSKTIEQGALRLIPDGQVG